MVPAVIENAKLKLAFAIPTDASIILTKEAIDTPPLVTDKTIRALSKQSKAAIYLQSLSRVSAIK